MLASRRPMLTSFRSMLTCRRPMLPEQILTVFIVPRFFHKSNVKSLRSVFRRRETKVERTLYSTITNPNKRSKSLFPRRRPPVLLKESECRSISGIIGSRFVASPKNNPMTSPPLGRCYLFSTSGTRPSNGGREISKKKLKKKNTSNRHKGLKFGNMSKKVIFYTKMQKAGK